MAMQKKYTQKRRLASMLSVRLAPAEEEVVRQAAESRGESVSTFVRQAAVQEATGTRHTVYPLATGTVSAGVTLDYSGNGQLLARVPNGVYVDMGSTGGNVAKVSGTDHWRAKKG